MKTYVRNDFKLKPLDSIKDVRNDFKLYFKTLDVTTTRDLTINYSFSEIATKLFDSSGLFTPSTLTPYFVIQKSGTNY